MLYSAVSTLAAQPRWEQIKRQSVALWSLSSVTQIMRDFRSGRCYFYSSGNTISRSNKLGHVQNKQLVFFSSLETFDTYLRFTKEVNWNELIVDQPNYCFFFTFTHSHTDEDSDSILFYCRVILPWGSSNTILKQIVSEMWVSPGETNEIFMLLYFPFICQLEKT